MAAGARMGVAIGGGRGRRAARGAEEASSVDWRAPRPVALLSVGLGRARRRPRGRPDGGEGQQGQPGPERGEEEEQERVPSGHARGRGGGGVGWRARCSAPALPRHTPARSTSPPARRAPCRPTSRPARARSPRSRRAARRRPGRRPRCSPWSPTWSSKVWEGCGARGEVCSGRGGWDGAGRIVPVSRRCGSAPRPRPMPLTPAHRPLVSQRAHGGLAGSGQRGVGQHHAQGQGRAARAAQSGERER